MARTTEFSSLCAALGVAFDLHDSKDGILEVGNIEKRQKVIQHRTLNRHEALQMKRKLGFAYGFLHERVGALVLKRLVDHAYSFTNSVDDELAAALDLMVDGLRCAGPNRVDSTTVFIWQPGLCWRPRPRRCASELRWKLLCMVTALGS